MAEEGATNLSRRVAATDDLEVSTYLEIAGSKVGQAETPHPDAQAERAYQPETVVVLDFGSQYSMLIARRVRECHVYCEILPYNAPAEQVAKLNPRGFILSGGPASVYEPSAPMAPAYVYESGVPILGICYGMQALTHQLGGKVSSGLKREYGHAVLRQNVVDHPIFKGLPLEMPVWMSHGDEISEAPPGFSSLAYTDNAPVAVLGNDQGIIGLQFHPEVSHTPNGADILKNFLYEVCGCKGTWTPASFITEATDRIRDQVGGGKVICALSGGVDSAVTAALVQKAIGDQLTCIFVDNGLLRREESERVRGVFERHLNLNLIYVDAVDRFLERLEGVTDPERKRHIIGEEFIRVFEEEAGRLGEVNYLAQGTLYPDVIESLPPADAPSVTIKTHHNVGGLPDVMKLSLVEPLRQLFKDEVREVGDELGMPEEMVYRQPFPGPGLAIRIIGEVTRERLEVLRSADWIVMDVIKASGLYHKLWQSFAVLTPLHTVGVMGDFRTYGSMVAIRAVTSEDAMTADWARLPYDVLAQISSRIVNEVPGVNRVVYDISSKPPSTIEWE